MATFGIFHIFIGQKVSENLFFSESSFSYDVVFILFSMLGVRIFATILHIGGDRMMLEGAGEKLMSW